MKWEFSYLLGGCNSKAAILTVMGGGIKGVIKWIKI